MDASVDVKTSPVYFYVQRSAHFSTTKTPIPFDLERLNVGGGMNLTTGKFTTPWDGIYAFLFTGHASFPPSSSTVSLHVWMYYLNGNSTIGNWIGSGYASEVGSTVIQLETFSFQSTLNLKKGHQIWLEIGIMTRETSLWSGTQFSGFLLEEKIVTG